MARAAAIAGSSSAGAGSRPAREPRAARHRRTQRDRQPRSRPARRWMRRRSHRPEQSHDSLSAAPRPPAGGSAATQLRLEPLPPRPRLRRLQTRRRHRVELAQHDARLDRAVPVVDLEPHRGVDRVVVPDPEPRAAEGDAERPVGAAVEAEAGVLALAHRPHVADPGRRDEQPHPRVAHPERGRGGDSSSARSRPRLGAADHRVDPLGPAQVLRAEHGSRRGRRRPRGRRRGSRLAAPARRRRGARRSRPGAPSTPRAPASRSKPGMLRPEPRPPPSPSSEIDDDRPVVALDQARGDDPDHARVPALAGERPGPAPRAAHREARAGPPRRPRRPRARSPAARCWRGSARAAISAARSSSSVRNSSTPASAR